MMFIPTISKMHDSAALSAMNESADDYIVSSHTYRTGNDAVHNFTTQ